MTFTGKDRLDVKRRALGYWYNTAQKRGHSLQEFLRRCRLSADGRRIVYYPG